MNEFKERLKQIILKSKIAGQLNAVEPIALPISKCSRVCDALVCFLILIPLYVAIVLPLTIVYIVLIMPFRLMCKKCCSSNGRPALSPAELSQLKMKIVPALYAYRQYDIILYGATGYTGTRSLRASYSTIRGDI